MEETTVSPNNSSPPERHAAPAAGVREPERDSGSPDHVGLIRAYLGAIERSAGAAALSRYFTPDVVQEELPNRLLPTGQRRRLGTLLESIVRTQALLRSQRFDVRRIVEHGDSIAVEAFWTAVLAVPLGALSAGGQIRAHVAIFFEFRDGLISAQRNYDCYLPF